MNSVSLVGRLTRDPEVRVAGEINIASFSIAVNRRGKDQEADFINCKAFGKAADFIGQYFFKGMSIGITGRIQTGSYTNKDGVKVYTTDVIVENAEFTEKKNSDHVANADPKTTNDGFMQIPTDSEEPFQFN